MNQGGVKILGDLTRTGRLVRHDVEINGNASAQPTGVWEQLFADFSERPLHIGALPPGIPAMAINGVSDTREGVLWKRTFSLRAQHIDNSPDEGWEAQDRDNPTYRLQTTLEEQPIATHPNIKRLIDLYGGVTKDDGTVDFPRTLMASKMPSGLTKEPEDMQNPMWGQKQWLAVRVVFSIQYFLPAGEWKKLGEAVVRSGTIDRPPNPPSTPNRDWLHLGVEMEISGTMYDATESWLLSQPGGWFKDLYSRGALGGGK